MDKETLIKEQEKDCCGKYCCCHCPVCFPENNIVDCVASAVIADLPRAWEDSPDCIGELWGLDDVQYYLKKRWGLNNGP